MRSFSLFGFLLCIQALVHAQAPIYEAIALPGGPSLINDNNEVVGITMQDGKEAIFVWNDGVTTISPAFGERVRITGFNNRGEIVGGIWHNGGWRGWHRTATGEDRLLPGWSAEGINDRGDIIGRGFDGKGFLISGDPPHTVTATPAELHAINNAGLGVGRTSEGATLWRQFPNQFESILPLRSASVLSSATANDISPNGLIVGSFSLYNYDAQPGFWDGQTWRELAAPMHRGAAAEAVNSAGVIVGSRRFDPDQNGMARYGAVIWTTNRTGYDLATITRLAVGTNLYDGTDINENGLIIAGGFLLKPIGSLSSLPELEVVNPVQHIQHTSNVLASVRFTKGSAPLAKVIYRLLKRTSSEGFSPGAFRFTTWSERVNEATQPPFDVVFTNLGTGQYFISVEAVTEGGVSIYLPSKKFLVTRPAQLDLLRNRLDGAVDVGFIGSPGRLYTIEGSDDLKTWTSLGLPPTRGGNFTLTNSPGLSRFYRLIVTAEDPEIFGMPYQMPHAMSYLPSAGTFSLFPTGGAAAPIRFSFDNGTFEAQWPDGSRTFSGTYEFIADPVFPKVRFTSPTTIAEISLQSAITATDKPQFRARLTTGSTTEIFSGRYELHVP